MMALLIPLAGLVAKLVEIGAQAYTDSHKQHADIVAAYQTALDDAKGLLAQMQADHAALDAEVEGIIASSR